MAAFVFAPAAAACRFSLEVNTLALMLLQLLRGTAGRGSRGLLESLRQRLERRTEARTKQMACGRRECLHKLACIACCEECCLVGGGLIRLVLEQGANTLWFCGRVSHFLNYNDHGWQLRRDQLFCWGLHNNSH